MPSVLHDSGACPVSIGLLEDLRTWELSLLRKIIPIRYQESRHDYMKKSAEKIDELRKNEQQPHLLHIYLDSYFRNVHKQFHLTDILGQKPTQTFRNYREVEGWLDFREEHPVKRQKLGVQCTAEITRDLTRTRTIHCRSIRGNLERTHQKPRHQTMGKRVSGENTIFSHPVRTPNRSKTIGRPQSDQKDKTRQRQTSAGGDRRSNRPRRTT